MGTDNQSDYFALTSIRTNLDSAGLLEGLQRVVIYKADATDGDPPAVCTGTHHGDDGEVQHLHRRPGAVGRRGPVQRDHRLHDRGAPSRTTARTARITAQGTADSIGVYVQARQKSLTGFFGGAGFLASRDAVMRMEPS